MIDLIGLSVISSLKVESADRLRNAELFLRYFESFFAGYEMVLVEQGASESAIAHLLGTRPNVKHRFLKSSNCHHKTRNLNLAAAMSTGEHILMCDIDVFLPPEAVIEARQRLTDSDFVYPYNGVAVQVKQSAIAPDLDFKALLQNAMFFPKHFDVHPHEYSNAVCEPMYGGFMYDSTGGAIMFRRDPFFAIGGWNENIISYGFEDMEFSERITRLNGSAARLPDYNCYHFEHSRGAESCFNNFLEANQQEYLKVSAMDREALQQYIDAGFRHLRTDSFKEMEVINTQDEFAMRVNLSNRVDLSTHSIVIAIRRRSKGTIVGFSKLLSYLESSFNGYELLIVEVGSRKFKYMANKKYIQYHWLDSGHSLPEALDFGRSRCTRTSLETFIFDDEFEVEAVIEKFNRIAQGAVPVA